MPWRWRSDAEAGAARDWTWPRQTQNKREETEDEFAGRSSLGGCLSGVCTFASSEVSLSLRPVIRLQLRQSAREKEKKRVRGYLRIHTHLHGFDAEAERETWSLFVLDGGSPVRADGRRRTDGFLNAS